MRHFLADWRRWSWIERTMAVAGLLVAAAGPVIPYIAAA
jgi:hypothetical protein